MIQKWDVRDRKRRNHVGKAEDAVERDDRSRSVDLKKWTMKASWKERIEC